MTSLSYRHIGSLYLSILNFSCKYPFPLGSLKYTYICYSITLYDSLTPTLGSPYFEDPGQAVMLCNTGCTMFYLSRGISMYHVLCV